MPLFNSVRYRSTDNKIRHETCCN